ncbi:MAG: glycosyltransferase family 4 protein [Crocinitomicaceae bacterium]
MRILYITHKPIYPIIDGGCVAMNNFLKCLLKAEVKVKHICISTNKHPFDFSLHPLEYQSSINIDNHYIDTDVTHTRGFFGLFQSGSYNINRFHCKNLQKRIGHELEQHEYDCVILESLFTTTYIDSIRSKSNSTIFIRTHNIEHKITSDLAKNASGAKRVYLSKLSKDLKVYEIEALNKADGILSISKNDTEQLKNLGIMTPIKNIGVAIPIKEIQNNYDSSGIFHLGSMNWQPNIEAVKRLINIFPEIKKSAPLCEVHIAGSAENSKLKSHPKNQIYFDGFVDDPNEFAINKGILVSPITSGSGVRIKILEMMSIGIPIITTTLGASGINHHDSNALVIADNDTEIIDATLKLIKNKNIRKEVGQNAIEYIRKNHNIESISKEIIEFIQGT